MARRASAAAVLCLLLAGLVGCGGSGDESAGNPRRALHRWYVGVERSVAAMEAKQRGFTRFSVDEPPAKSAIVPLSPAGARAGETAAGAADRLDAATALTADEAAGLYCYFFAFYVDLEFFPDEDEFEVVILNLVKTRLSSSSASPDEVRESAVKLRRAMIAAEKAGRHGGEVAAATFC